MLAGLFERPMKSNDGLAHADFTQTSYSTNSLLIGFAWRSDSPSHASAVRGATWRNGTGPFAVFLLEPKTELPGGPPP